MNKKINPKCSICGFYSEYFLTRTLLKKYKVKYFRCTNCRFIEAEKPRYWLKESYSSTIMDMDTGIIGRNLILSKVAALTFALLCKKNAKILDYGGGYGIMARMLRDIGLDCYWYDKYAENVFAKKFVFNKKSTYEMVTAFEVLEHLKDPIKEIREIMRKFSPKIFLFSTTVHNGKPPDNWWYFSDDGGQHISLYTQKTLEIIASKLRLSYSTNGVNVHIFSKFRILSILILIISVLYPIGSIFFPIYYKSKTLSDCTLSK